MIAGLILALVIGNPLLEKYNNEIEKYLSKTLSKSVEFDTIRFNTYPLFSLEIENLKVDNEKILIPSAKVSFSLLNLSVSKVQLNSPKFEFRESGIKQESNFNFKEDSFDYDSLNYILNPSPRYNLYSRSIDTNLIKYISSLKKIEIRNARISSRKHLEENNQKKVGELNYALKNLNLILRKKINQSYVLSFNTEINKKEIKGVLESDFNVNYKNNNLSFKGDANFTTEKKKYSISQLDLNSIFSLDQDIISFIGLNGKLLYNDSREAYFKIFPFYSKQYLSFFVEIESDFKASTIVELREDLRIWDTSVEYGQDFKLEIGKIYSELENVYKLKDSTLFLSDSKASINSSFDLVNNKYALRLDTNALDLKDLDKLSSKYGYAMPEASLTGSLQYLYEDNTSSLSSSQLMIKNLNYENVNASFIELGNFKLMLDAQNQVEECSTNYNLKDFKMNVAPVDKYSAGELKGFLNYKQGRATGSSYLENFSFTDSFVFINNLSGELNNIEFTHSKENGFKLKTNILAQSIYLNVPDYELKSVDSLSGPVTLEIDTEGRYRVYGLAGGENALMRYLDKSFNVNGGINFDVSKKFKNFLSKSLKGRVNSKDYHIQEIDFEITKDFYELKKSNLNIFNGQGSLAGKWGRRISPFELDLDFNNLSMNEFDGVLKNKKNLSGEMEKLKLKIKGDKKKTETYNGAGEVKFKDGILKSLELDTILSNPAKKEEVKEDDPGTYVENLEFKAKIDNGIALTDDLILAGKFYTLQAKGQYSFTEGFDVKGSAVYLEKTLSELGGPFKFLRKLIGSIGKIEIPVKIKGETSDPEVEADLSNMHRLISPGRAVENIGKGVEEMFDGIKDVVSGN